MTLRPMTAPPLKAILKALVSPLRAAFAVRTLASVATSMPRYPAKAEQADPKR